MRRLLHQAIIAQSALTAFIPAGRWYQQGAVDAQPAVPFAVIGFVGTAPTPSRSGQPVVQIWVHDKKGSYAKIDRILEILRSDLEALGEIYDGSSRIVDIRWNGDSGDLVDDGFDTNTKYGSFTITGRI